VVIAFQQMRGNRWRVKRWPRQGFRLLCWDLYAKATQFFEEDKFAQGNCVGDAEGDRSRRRCDAEWLQ